MGISILKDTWKGIFYQVGVSIVQLKMEEFDISVETQWVSYSLLYFASIFISLMLPYILYPMPLPIPYSYLLLHNSRKIPKLTLIFTFSFSLNTRISFYKEHQKITKIIPTKLLKLQFL